LSVADETPDNGSQEVTVQEEEHIHPHEGSSFVREEDIRDRDLTQSFDRHAEKADKTTVSNPGTVGLGVCRPDIHCLQLVIGHLGGTIVPIKR
jgi:hypothetical protein